MGARENRTPGYLKVRDALAGKDWNIIGFSAWTFVVRIEKENVEFDRYKGIVRSRFKL